MRNECFICHVMSKSDPWKVISIHQFCYQKYINRSIHHSIPWLQTIYLSNDRTLIWKILRDENNDSTAKLAENVIETFHGFKNNSKSHVVWRLDMSGYPTALSCSLDTWSDGLQVIVRSLLFASRSLLCLFLRIGRVLWEGT